MQIFKQWPLYFVGRILPAAIAFGAIGFYTRLVDPGSFGTYALLLSTSFLFGMTGFAWLRVATLRMMASVAHDDVPDFAATIAVTFCGVSAIVASAILVSIHIFNPALPFSLALLTAAAAVASNWFELNINLTQARMHLITYGVLQAARAIVVFGASIALIYAGLKAKALLGGFAIGNCVAFGMIGAWFPGFRGRFRREIFVRLLRFGWPASASSLSCAVPTIQRYLVGVFGGAAAIGVFAVANDFSTQTIGLLIGTVTIAGQPLAFRARDLGAVEALERQLRNNAQLLFAVSIAATAGMIALAKPIAHVFLGPSFRTGAEPIIIIAALATFASGLRASYFEQAFEIALETHPVAYLTAVRMTMTLLPSAFLIERYGAIGAGCSILLGETTALVASAIWAKRLIDMPIPLDALAKVGAATAAMVVAILVIPHRDTTTGLAIAIVCGIVTYVIAFAVVYREQLRRLIRVPGNVSQAANG